MRQLCWEDGPLMAWNGKRYIGSSCILEKDHKTDHDFRPDGRCTIPEIENIGG